MIWLLLLCSLCLSLGTSTRDPAKRYSKENVAEIYIVVDRKSLRPYEAESTMHTASARLNDAKSRIKDDIMYFLTQINILLASMQDYGANSVDVKLALRKLDILEYNIFSSSDIVNSSQVSSKTALDRFGNFLVNGRAFDSLHYDLALLYTGYTMLSTYSRSLGLAYVGTVCKGRYASSVVHFDGTYKIVPVTAHEIAHNLGADHDAQSSGFIMTPATSPDNIKRWTFSSKSATDIQLCIDKLSVNCMQTPTNANSVIPNSGITPALKDVNEICERSMKNTQSHVCTAPGYYGNKRPSGDEVCDMIYCSTASSVTTCSGAYSSDGMVCAKGKICSKGKCVCDYNYNADAASAQNDCLWGDHDVLLFEDIGAQTCDYINMAPYNCESTYVNDRCCATCKSHNTGIPGCEWGDRSPDCSKFQPTWNFCSVNGNICCQLCHGVRRRRSAGEADDDNIPVLTARKYVTPIPQLEDVEDPITTIL